MDFLSDLFGGGGASDPDTARKEEWLNENHSGSAPTGRTAEDEILPDGSSKAGTASGNGGVVGPISAAVGDISLGSGASADGDNTFNFGDTRFGDGPSKSSGLNVWHIALLGGFTLAAIKLMGSK